MSPPADAAFRGLRFRGGRFEEAGYPVDALAELARFERLVFLVARSLWLARNETRQRTPPGFKQSMQLRVIGVEAGSVVPVLDRPTAPQRPTRSNDSDDYTEVFQSATDLIEQTFAAIVNDLTFPSELSPALVADFLPFGASLQDNENVEFTPRGSNSPVVYNQQARRRLVSRASVESFSVERVVVGKVTGLDTDSQEFTLRDTRDNLITGHFHDPGQIAELRAVLERPALAPVVRIEGTLQVTASDRVEFIEDIQSVELFELPDAQWSQRLLELAGLRRGWFDGNGCEISFAALDFARDTLRRIDDQGVAIQGIFPIPSGGVQLEWKSSRQVVSLDIDPDAICQAFSLILSSDRDIEQTFTSPADSADFVARAFDE